MMGTHGELLHNSELARGSTPCVKRTRSYVSYKHRSYVKRFEAVPNTSFGGGDEQEEEAREGGGEE